MHRVICISLFAIWMSHGCISLGGEFPVEEIRSLTRGETTQDEVRRRFGAPWRTGLEDGQRTWTYADYHYTLFGGTRTRDLVIRFDAEGRVESYTFNSTHAEDANL